jgi:hypothetical protein
MESHQIRQLSPLILYIRLVYLLLVTGQLYPPWSPTHCYTNNSESHLPDRRNYFGFGRVPFGSRSCPVASLLLLSKAIAALYIRRSNSGNVKPIAKMIYLRLLGFLHIGPTRFFPRSMYPHLCYLSSSYPPWHLQANLGLAMPTRMS